MRITDSNTTDIDRFAAYINRLVDYHVCVGLHRNACRIKIGLADIDLSRSYLAVERIQTNVLYAAVGFNFHCRFRHNSVIIEELCSTANTVRSHERLSSVVVINNHFCIGNIRFFNENNAVAADSVMTVGEVDSQRLG